MAKRIVLLSDGTGNSSAQLLKTNVWRIYESLRLDDPKEQVACYDDGVGTSSFKPLALLGGAFGVGLKRNVLRLYRFLCEHFEEEDRIYLFGFSRGAFTVRLLVELICHQGIIRAGAATRLRSSRDVALRGAFDSRNPPPGASDVLHRSASSPIFGSELARLSRWAYRDFRKKFNQTGLLVDLARLIRDHGYRALEGRGGRYEKQKNYQLKPGDLAFVGVWDTVDAYGLPIDELTDGIDKWVWPLSMPDQKLSPMVARACHVLALDDERNTFHPVLWDESSEPQDKAHVDDERISQVWFAGMHSNVGGGYPDDALSVVSLRWMLDRVAALPEPLLFNKTLLDCHLGKCDTLGRLYDSRSGLKAYYRYNPRRIEWLTNGQVHQSQALQNPWVHALVLPWLKMEQALDWLAVTLFGKKWREPQPTVTIPRPKIHESAIERIATAPEAYSPIVLPRDYAIVTAAGAIVDPAVHEFESIDAREKRVAAQEMVWNLVWWRRVLYFAAVAVTFVLLVVRPFRSGALEEAATLERGVLSRVVSMLGSVLPDVVAPWKNYYAAYPGELLLGLGLLIALSWMGSRLQGRICDRMRKIWLSVTPPAHQRLDDLEAPRGILQVVRLSAVYQGIFALLRGRVFPTITGLTALLWIAGIANRVPFEAANLFGVFCGAEAQPAVKLFPGEVRSGLTLASDQACNSTGVLLEARARYVVALDEPTDGVWRDASIDVPFPGGATAGTANLNLAQRGVYMAFVPFRRLWTSPWFLPVARIGHTGANYVPLRSTRNVLVPETTGELILFVNDAIAPVGPDGFGWAAYYRNNTGATVVSVARLVDEPGLLSAR